jgi:hypothetical protein
MDHWKAAKKVLHYLQGTKDYMLTFRKSNILEVLTFLGALIAENSHHATYSYLHGDQFHERVLNSL